MRVLFICKLLFICNSSGNKFSVKMCQYRATPCQNCVKTVPKLDLTVSNHTLFRHLARLRRSLAQFSTILAQFGIMKLNKNMCYFLASPDTVWHNIGTVWHNEN